MKLNELFQNEGLTAAQHRARMLGKMFPKGKPASPDKSKEEVKKALDKMKSPNNIRDIKETFDSPYPFKWISQDEKKFVAQFDTDDGSKVAVTFERHDESWLVMFSKNDDFEVTNEGDEFKIMGSVLNIIRSFISIQSPKQMYFVAEKNPSAPTSKNSSRIQVYSRMVKKFAASVGYSFEVRDQGWKSVFYISKSNQKQVSEEKEVDALELPNIKVGDEIRTGRFKNRKAEVKGFKTDDKTNHPILKTSKGDVQLFKPRISKLLPEEDDLTEGTVSKFWINPDKRKIIDTSNEHHTLDAFHKPAKYGLSGKIWGNYQHEEYLYDEKIAKVMHENGWARVSDNGSDWNVDALNNVEAAKTLRFMRQNNFLFDSVHVKTNHEQFILISPQQIKLFVRTGKRPNSISGAFREEDHGEEL